MFGGSPGEDYILSDQLDLFAEAKRPLKPPAAVKPPATPALHVPTAPQGRVQCSMQGCGHPADLALQAMGWTKPEPVCRPCCDKIIAGVQT